MHGGHKSVGVSRESLQSRKGPLPGRPLAIPWSLVPAAQGCPGRNRYRLGLKFGDISILSGVSGPGPRSVSCGGLGIFLNSEMRGEVAAVPTYTLHPHLNPTIPTSITPQDGAMDEALQRGGRARALGVSWGHACGRTRVSYVCPKCVLRCPKCVLCVLSVSWGRVLA